MPRFPRRSPAADGLSDRVYSPLVERARAMPGPVHALQVGDTWRDPPPVALEALAAAARAPGGLRYGPVQGEPALLDAILRRMARRGPAPDRERVQVMPGATTGLAVIATALLAPGDELLLPSPFWPLIRGIAATRGCAAVEVPFFTRLDEPGFDPEAELERAVTPRTAAVYVNSPHNPTGRVLPEPVLAAIGRVARRHDLWIVADEAYEELVYGAPAPAPLWARPELAERTVAIHTVSKSHALAGARVGWAHGPAEAMSAIRGVQTYESYCAAPPMQRAAARALDEGDAWLAETRAHYAAAARTAATALGVRVPEAGTFLAMDAAPAFRPGEALDGFLSRALDAGVLVTPGAGIGRAFGTWIRLCFTAVPPDALADAVRRLAPLLRPSPEETR